MLHWLHHLFNPHCDRCEAKPACNTCEELKSLLATEKHEKKLLLDSILALHKPHVEQITIKEQETPQPVGNRRAPWRVRQEMLENEERARLKIIHDKNNELEKELNVLNGTGN